MYLYEQRGNWYIIVWENADYIIVDYTRVYLHGSNTYEANYSFKSYRLITVTSNIDDFVSNTNNNNNSNTIR